MADPTNRATLQSFYSFPSHLVHYAAARPGKRRASDASQFVPAESTFHPRPYQPTPAVNAPSRQVSRPPTSQASTTSTSSRQNSVQRNRPTQAADPSPHDPSAVFIHPPFTDFPEAHKYKDGLTYNLMAANPEWFLDPADFIAPGNENPDAIGYPSQLEPPRGWCPQKKTKEGWAQGEEPKLRCTFCRRFYSGANAKSMWRRHVLEKHKIAMANRRDNPTGRGGRTSNSVYALPITSRCTDCSLQRRIALLAVTKASEVLMHLQHRRRRLVLTSWTRRTKSWSSPAHRKPGPTKLSQTCSVPSTRPARRP